MPWREDIRRHGPETVLEGSWAAQQLAELLGWLSAHTNPATVAERGIERVAEILEAEIVALVRPGCETVSIGFPFDQYPEGLLERQVTEPVEQVLVPRLGPCAVVSEPLDRERLQWLVVARAGGPYSPEERDLLRGAARVLDLANQMLGRRLLLERVSGIQTLLVRRTRPQEILDLIVASAAELTGSDISVLRHAGPPPGRVATLGACVGLSEEERRLMSDSPGRGLTRQVLEQGRLIVRDDYQADPASNAMLQSNGVSSLMGAPVREGETVVGALLVGSRGAGRRYSEAEKAALETFAEHASMALIDARMVADAIHRSLHDPLTELPNRELFSDRLAQAIGRAERASSKVAVLFIDIDRFKTVNDSLGHRAGDGVLIAAAHRLDACLRPGDTVARLGGDEFAILVEDADEELGQAVADRVLVALERPFAIAGRTVQLSASIGIAVAGKVGEDPLRDGDLAMYGAKAEGRGRTSVFRPAMRAAVRERLALEAELRGADQRDELFLEYQPIVELTSGRLAMVEALLRWEHPVRGRLEPAAFLQLAEETGAIDPFGRWVIRAACEQARRWQPAAARPIPVCVNVSPAQLHAGDIVRAVADALSVTGLRPEALIIELTETVIMQDVVSAVQRLRGLRELGVSLAVDDFGTGYCSLQYLQQFPVDYLKIASPFVADIAGPDADLSLIRAITDLGISCGLQLIAEGIEYAHQRDQLVEIGCELGQGFLFARPESAQELISRLPVSS